MPYVPHRVSKGIVMMMMMIISTDPSNLPFDPFPLKGLCHWGFTDINFLKIAHHLSFYTKCLYHSKRNLTSEFSKGEQTILI